MVRRDLRATWPQALGTLLGPLFLFFGVRWLLAEPFIIPSGSMIPTLRVHDHILVNKLAYGAHIPFSKKWIAQWGTPHRGDIVVFRFPENPDVFYVKRAIGVPGDHVSLDQGHLRINGQSIAIEKAEIPPDLVEDEGFDYFREENHVIRYRDAENAFSEEFTVPSGHFFVLGDNRDQSNDSRFWGFVPDENLVGRAWLIWLACDSTLPSAQFLCDPTSIKWNRIFKLPN